MTPGSPALVAAARAQSAAWHANFMLLRRALFTFVLALLACGALLGSSAALLQDRQALLSQARQLHAAGAARLRRVEADRLDILQYQARFTELQGTNLIGEERRLDWIEAIRQIQSARKLLPVAYEFEAQQPFRIDGEVDTGDYQMLGSKMKLHMALLHEMDLLYFLDDLRSSGFFALQDCSIKRLASDPGRPANLAADCTLNWLTLGLPATPTTPTTPAPPGTAP